MAKNRKQTANAEMARVFREIEKVEARAKRIAASKTAKEVFDLSPEFTGWFKANHNMVFTEKEKGRVFMPVNPPTRPKPDERGAMEAEAASNEANLVAKALTIEQGRNNPDRIVIGNAIHYAKDVGIINGRPNIGNGIRIMKQAAERGAKEVDRRFKD